MHTCGNIKRAVLLTRFNAIKTNSQQTHRGGVVGEIWKHLGKDLERECQKADKVRTGEVCLTSAGNLPCKRLLHTVGPRYNEQYKTAAENALHFCYRNSLRMLKEEVSVSGFGECCLCYCLSERYNKKLTQPHAVSQNASAHLRVHEEEALP